MKKILVVDAQGGGLGSQIIKALLENNANLDITAVGTNSAATSAMLKAGAKRGATGENSVVVLSADADIIVGPIGIVVADSMLGEITEKMASAIGKSHALRVLIPINQCSNYVVGVNEKTIKELVGEAVDKVLDEDPGCYR